jgi:hypothetical protein
MTYQEAANYLRISLATIERMVHAAKISSVVEDACFESVTWTSIFTPTAFSVANKAVCAVTRLC